MKKILRLAFGLAGIVAFICLLPHLLQQSRAYRQLLHEVEKQGIEADALFYTESPKALERSHHLKRQINRTPKQ